MQPPSNKLRTRRRSSQLFNRLFLLYWDWRVMAGALVTAFCLLCMVVALFLGTRSAGPEQVQATAILNIIPATTPTPTIAASAPVGTPTPESSLPSPPPGVVAIGAYVQVIGTGGNGLRLRDQPGLSGQVLLLGSEAEVFRVEDGPKDIDGFTWWYLVGPFDEQRHGWAVVNYLQVVQSP